MMTRRRRKRRVLRRMLVNENQPMRTKKSETRMPSCFVSVMLLQLRACDLCCCA